MIVLNIKALAERVLERGTQFMSDPQARDLTILAREVLRLQEENERLKYDLNPNPKCTHGLHPMWAADRTCPEGTCLWCEDIKKDKRCT